MAMISGTFPDAFGNPTSHDRMHVEVTVDRDRLRFRVPSCGAGSVKISNGNGTGMFRAINGTQFRLVLEPRDRETRYRVYDNDVQIATGIITDLPHSP